MEAAIETASGKKADAMLGKPNPITLKFMMKEHLIPESELDK
jgi:hypothetical protein